MTFADWYRERVGWAEHFGPGELAQEDEPPRELWVNILPTLAVAERLRGVVGPLVVASGYRSPAHNRRVGGKPQSLHLAFNALDLRSPTVEPAVLFGLLADDPYAHLFGLGLYSTFVHLDTRGFLGRQVPARW